MSHKHHFLSNTFHVAKSESTFNTFFNYIFAPYAKGIGDNLDFINIYIYTQSELIFQLALAQILYIL